MNGSKPRLRLIRVIRAHPCHPWFPRSGIEHKAATRGWRLSRPIAPFKHPESDAPSFPSENAHFPGFDAGDGFHPIQRPSPYPIHRPHSSIRGHASLTTRYSYGYPPAPEHARIARVLVLDSSVQKIDGKWLTTAKSLC